MIDPINPGNQEVFVTKYALTKGILVFKLEEISGNMVVVKDPNGRNRVSYFHGPGKDWHLNLISAQVRVQEMAANSIRSHQRQIAKLEKITIQGAKVFAVESE